MIVQAGGKGSRLQHLTANKPKALVPVDNLPMIFHLFRRFSNKRFVIIGDYKFDVLERYLRAFADVDYQLVNGNGKVGTCAGLSDALALIPEGRPFLLIWCDLILPEGYSLPQGHGNYVGISKDFPCRWKYENGHFKEERSTEHGVAGFFVFKDKRELADVPESGEFVRYLSGKDVAFIEEPLYKTHEYGLLEEWDKLPKRRTRPFNKLVIEGDMVTKVPVDKLGEDLATKEEDWYRKAQSLGFRHIPRVYSFDPLRMELIQGQSLYETGDWSIERKAGLLKALISHLMEMHALDKAPLDEESYLDAYYHKTVKRLEKVSNLVPFAKEPTIVVNGHECRNPLFHWKWVLETLKHYEPSEFCFIHGDCTFSNTMVNENDGPVFLDPRGYFGKTLFYGDPAYDWAKLYYSVVGDYDQFNLKRFRLLIGEDSVNLEIATNGYRELEPLFFEALNKEVAPGQIALYHALIWLSLTTYAWEDYDSICGAFYNGVRYFEEAMRLHGN